MVGIAKEYPFDWSQFLEPSFATPNDHVRFWGGGTVEPTIATAWLVEPDDVPSNNVVDLAAARALLSYDPTAFRIHVTNFDALLKTSPQRKDVHRQAIVDRVSALRDDAAEDGEAFDEPSAAYLTSFCANLAASVKPAIFRLQAGMLRALWEDRSSGSQIGLQFLPNGLIQYVLLRSRRGDLLKTLGVDQPQMVQEIVDLLGLRQLWFRG